MNKKKCSKCHIEKDICLFFVDKQKQDGISSWCKECKYAFNKEWSLENKDRHSFLIRKWEVENRISYRNYQRNWVNINRDRVNKLARERCSNEYFKKKYLRTKELNPSHYNNMVAKRRAHKTKAMPVWANKKEICWHYKYAKEISLLDGIEYHVDHIIPLKHSLVCGLHVENNLQVISATENVRKSNSWQPF